MKAILHVSNAADRVEEASGAGMLAYAASLFDKRGDSAGGLKHLTRGAELGELLC